MKRVEGPVICNAVLLPDNDRRGAHREQCHIHEQACSSPIAISKRMDVSKLRMKKGYDDQGVCFVVHMAVDVIQKPLDAPLDILRAMPPRQTPPQRNDDA